jgi:hypothetical protein
MKDVKTHMKEMLHTHWKIVWAAAMLFLFTGAGMFFAFGTREPSRAPALIASGFSPKVAPILDESCADCHSSLYHRPWYGNLPVISNLINDDVVRGDRFLDLTRWQQYSRGRKIGFLTSMEYVLDHREMPPERYWIVHPDAKLSRQDSASLRQWAVNELHGLRPVNARALNNAKSN